jgi:hypothetical protein
MGSRYIGGSQAYQLMPWYKYRQVPCPGIDTSWHSRSFVLSVVTAAGFVLLPATRDETAETIAAASHGLHAFVRPPGTISNRACRHLKPPEEAPLGMWC